MLNRSTNYPAILKNENITELAEEITKWIDENNYETYSLSIGYDRNDTNYNIAEELAERWQYNQTCVRVDGGFIITLVNWPETAASWLAQAKELNKDRPDAIAIISSISSGLAVLKRLADQQNWSASQTFCIFDDTETLQRYAAELSVHSGLKCIMKDGSRWIVDSVGLQQIK
ncbi:hypothetical protein BC749_108234 [Flavobacterium araucananum]|uniref:Uncharacterized protein n=1 Tax=Flavobacterium araucananum TaxID=946678 RepID=A0A227NHG8_9FLAO|nr:hypothetical protein [Flavobacterium araucananum]OXE97143.1 hypothetical protein B0A64_23520 [Flavobacterium araucananum]PWJ97083.1 hypothetical protein BC749_108234 [Flavobacterium araucananum]